MALPDVVAGARVVRGPVPFTDVEDATVRRGAPDGTHQIAADRQRAVVRVAGVARFAISGGTDVEVDAQDEDAAAVWLYGTVTALVLAQQGRFALHASVVDADGAGVALSGRRRAGKSTTALCLARRGHRVVSDDVAPLDVVGDAVVHRATGRPMHVWPDAADRLALDTTGAGVVQRGHDKLVLPLPAGGAVEVRRCVILNPGASDRRLAGPAAAAALFANVYRIGLLRELYGQAILHWATAVAARTEVLVVGRPAGEWTVDAVADAVVPAHLPRV